MRVIHIAVLALLANCFFDPSVSSDVNVRCQSSADCPLGLHCLTEAGRCVDPRTQCVVLRDEEVSLVADGNTCDTGICVAGACVTPRCGDGIVTPSEEEACDDGNTIDGDTCTNACQIARCGDGIVQVGLEACDDGNRDDTDGCRNSCGLPTCGDGVVQAGAEDCDDGNNEAGDRCLPSCLLNTCGDGVLNPLDEACDDNNSVDEDSCLASCQLNVCGDTFINLGIETCDDGNTESGDGCRSDCRKIEICGDAIVDQGEACDDGNLNPCDGCDRCRPQIWRRKVVVSGRIEGSLARDAGLAGPKAVTVDAIGRVFIADTANHRVLRIDIDGTITTTAGTGAPGFSGDLGPATSAQLDQPSSVATDTSGRVYIADTNNHRVRRVDPNGEIVTIAGNGRPGTDGDGGPATGASLTSPGAVGVDSWGRVYIADGSHRIRRVDASGLIATVVGTGQEGFAGDGGLATDALIRGGGGLAFDRLGRLCLADVGNQRVRRVDADGIITTIAGTGLAGFSGDGGLATAAQLSSPVSVAIDAGDRVYIADKYNARIRVVDADGQINTVVGNGTHGFSGDGGPADSAELSYPAAVWVDADGQILIATGNRIRRVDRSGEIDTISGKDATGFSGDGGPATSAQLADPAAVALDGRGQIYIADADNVDNHRIRRVNEDGVIETVAGLGPQGPGGDGGPATYAYLASPAAVFVDTLGQLYIADKSNNRIRRVDTEGIITTVAGTGDPGFAGDGGPATSAKLFWPADVFIDHRGNMFIADEFNNRVRRVDPEGTITTVAGNGAQGHSGDGGPATGANLSRPSDVVVDAQGRLYISDSSTNCVRRVDADGIISTFVGTASYGFSGDGGPASSAELASPAGLAIDGSGQLYIADASNQRVRRVDVNGIITTVAGSDNLGLGDGGPAVSAQLVEPTGVAVDAAGQMFISDWGNNRIRRVDAAGTITTMVGPVHPPGPGPSARAKLYASRALLVIEDDLILSVGDFNRGVLWDRGRDVLEVAVGYEEGSPSAWSRAGYAPLLADPRGLAFHPATRQIVITEAASGQLRTIAVDQDLDGVVDDPATWASSPVAAHLVGPAGIAHDARDGSFIVVEEKNHCLRRVDFDGNILGTLYGRCGAPGSFPDFLDSPTQVLLSPASGAIYVADTGNNRVLRIDAQDGATLVVGDGSESSAGEGAPARLFPVHAPRQLAMDSHGNLFVTSTTTLRAVVNVDGDLDADGDDRVITVYGHGERETYPESGSLCLSALALADDETLFLADACQGFLVELRREILP